MKIKVTRHSLIDAPGECAVLYFPRCNMRCPYCYNVNLWNGIEDEGDMSLDEVEEFIASRIVEGPFASYKKVDWIMCSGGECTQYPEELRRLLSYAKGLDFKTGIYTNGTVPDVSDLIDSLTRDRLLDVVNLDYKWDVKNPEFSYTRFADWSKSFMTLLSELESERIQRLRINTVVMNSYHTRDVLGSMKNVLWGLIGPQEKPVIGLQSEIDWRAAFSWTLEPFFSYDGTIPTLDPIPPSETPSTAMLKALAFDLSDVNV
jgi:pyruvate formate lyase activating enzyme